MHTATTDEHSGGDPIAAFMERENLTLLGLKRNGEVFESALECESCGCRAVGERYEVKGRSARHHVSMTFIICRPCKETI